MVGASVGGSRLWRWRPRLTPLARSGPLCPALPPGLRRRADCRASRPPFGRAQKLSGGRGASAFASILQTELRLRVADGGRGAEAGGRDWKSLSAARRSGAGRRGLVASRTRSPPQVGLWLRGTHLSSGPRPSSVLFTQRARRGPDAQGVRDSDRRSPARVIPTGKMMMNDALFSP